MPTLKVQSPYCPINLLEKYIINRNGNIIAHANSETLADVMRDELAETDVN